jgi:hypothetical protein
LQAITEIAVYDLTGRLALHAIEPVGTGNHNLKLDVSSLRPGLYNVELKQGRSYSREKLTVVR